MAPRFDPNKYGNPASRNRKRQPSKRKPVSQPIAEESSLQQKDDKMEKSPLDSESRDSKLFKPSESGNAEAGQTKAGDVQIQPPYREHPGTKADPKHSSFVISGFNPHKYGTPSPRVQSSFATETPVTWVIRETPVFESPTTVPNATNGSDTAHDATDTISGSSQVLQQTSFGSQPSPLSPNPALQNRAKAEKPIPRPNPRPQGAQNVAEVEETKEQQLVRMQEDQLRKIGFRNRHKGGPQTTSLKDLELARRPVANDHRVNFEPQIDGTCIKATADHVEASPEVVACTPQVQAIVPVAPAALTSNTTTRQSQLNGCHSQPVTPNWASTPIKKESEPSQHTRWAVTAELKPIQMETNSNAWGSDVASNAEIESNDSVKPMHHGKLFRNKSVAVPESSLTGWDGKWQAPPVDWNDRPRFNNNSPDFRNTFNHWLNVTADLAVTPDPGVSFEPIPTEQVCDLEMHPDGLGLVPRDLGITANNAVKYGYSGETAECMARIPRVDRSDFGDWGKLDMSYGENARICEETTEKLVANWNAHHARAAKAHADNVQAHSPQPSSQQPPNDLCVAQARTPKVNIYLRPAVVSDICQLTDLFNWYIKNSPRPTEIQPLTPLDMRNRFDNCVSAKLPFLVAATKSSKVNRRLNNCVEKIVGFAAATDFSDVLFSERISVELEVYVHHEWLHKGVGWCLLDKLLASTDRGHLVSGSYPFTCDPTLRYCYEAGGGRDLHQLIFMVRHFKNPKTQLEKDFETWIKKWLVDEWDFEEVGCLRGVGAKFGRL